jgi:hypothetical protein
MKAELTVYFENESQLDGILTAIKDVTRSDVKVIKLPRKENTTTKRQSGPRTCRQCGSQFVPYHHDQEFCSPLCRKRHRKNQFINDHPELFIAKCAWCGKEYSKRSRKGSAYCSKQCQKRDWYVHNSESRNERRTIIRKLSTTGVMINVIAERKCQLCGNTFSPNSNHQVYCAQCAPVRSMKKKELSMPLSLDGKMSLKEALNQDYDIAMQDLKTKMEKAKVQQQAKREVRIDSRTIILVDANITDEEAIKAYNQKHGR